MTCRTNKNAHLVREENVVASLRVCVCVCVSVLGWWGITCEARFRERESAVLVFESAGTCKHVRVCTCVYMSVFLEQRERERERGREGERGRGREREREIH